MLVQAKSLCGWICSRQAYFITVLNLTTDSRIRFPNFQELMYAWLLKETLILADDSCICSTDLDLQYQLTYIYGDTKHWGIWLSSLTDCKDMQNNPIFHRLHMLTVTSPIQRPFHETAVPSKIKSWWVAWSNLHQPVHQPSDQSLPAINDSS